MDFNIKQCKIKNLLGIIDNPIIEDLLFEIMFFLYNEKRDDLIFNLKEVELKTRIRILDSVEQDINTLEEKGFIKKLKYTKYQVVNHLWKN